MADTLVITDGGPAGLLASWLEGAVRRDRPDGEVILWCDAPDDPTRARRLARTHDLAARCDQATVLEPPADLTTRTTDSRRLTDALVAVARAALEAEASRVIWPAQGDTVDAMAAIVDRAMLVGELVSLDAGDAPPSAEASGGAGAESDRMPGDGVVIETPFADLSDAQLADLIFDCDAPISLAWWCDQDREQPCGNCPSCARWQPLFDQAIPLV